MVENEIRWKVEYIGYNGEWEKWAFCRSYESALEVQKYLEEAGLCVSVHPVIVQGVKNGNAKRMGIKAKKRLFVSFG